MVLLYSLILFLPIRLGTTATAATSAGGCLFRRCWWEIKLEKSVSSFVSTETSTATPVPLTDCQAPDKVATDNITESQMSLCNLNDDSSVGGEEREGVGKQFLSLLVPSAGTLPLDVKDLLFRCRP